MGVALRTLLVANSPVAPRCGSHKVEEIATTIPTRSCASSLSRKVSAIENAALHTRNRQSDVIPIEFEHRPCQPFEPESRNRRRLVGGMGKHTMAETKNRVDERPLLRRGRVEIYRRLFAFLRSRVPERFNQRLQISRSCVVMGR